MELAEIGMVDGVTTPSPGRSSHPSPTDRGSGRRPGSRRSTPTLKSHVDSVVDLMRAQNEEEEEQEEKYRIADLLVILNLRISRKRLFKDFLIYLFFIIVFIVQLTLARNVMASHQMELALKAAIVEEEFPDLPVEKAYGDITKTEEFWQWVKGPLLEALTTTTFENDKALPPQMRYYVSNKNRLIGGMRFRQLRARPEPCANADMRRVYPVCLPAYDPTNSGTPPPFGKYRYMETQRGSATHTPTEFSKITPSWYEGGGYIADIKLQAPNRTVADDSDFLPKYVEAQIDALIADNFFDRGTRVMFISFLVYNGNSDHFMLPLFMVETDEGGRLSPFYTMKPFRVRMYVTVEDYGRLATELILMGLIVYFTVAELREIYSFYRKGQIMLYFSFWNVLDLLNLAFFWLVIVYQISYLARPIPPFLDDPNYREYAHMDGWARDYVSIVNFASFNVFLSFLKIFKFLQVSDRMSLIWRTLSVASTDLLAYMMFFFIVFLGFATMGHIQFGSSMPQFKSFYNSIMTCFSMTLGDFDLEGMSRVNRVLGPVFYVLFVVLVFFILVNMFLAIINDAYQEAHKNLSKLEFSDQMTRAWNKMLRRVRMRTREYAQNRGQDEELLDRLNNIDALQRSKHKDLTERNLRLRFGNYVSDREFERLMRLYHVLHDREGYREPLKRERRRHERNQRKKQRQLLRFRSAGSTSADETDEMRSGHGASQADGDNMYSEDDEDGSRDSMDNGSMEDTALEEEWDSLSEASEPEPGELVAAMQTMDARQQRMEREMDKLSRMLGELNTSMQLVAKHQHRMLHGSGSGSGSGSGGSSSSSSSSGAGRGSRRSSGRGG